MNKRMRQRYHLSEILLWGGGRIGKALEHRNGGVSLAGRKFFCLRYGDDDRRRHDRPDTANFGDKLESGFKTTSVNAP